MRFLVPFAIVIVMSTLAIAQTLPAPRAVTDPQQIASKPNAQVEKNLSIERLYMTRAIGGTAWSPDGKTLAFVGQRDGEFDIYSIPATGGEEKRLTTAKGLDDGPEEAELAHHTRTFVGCDFFAATKRSQENEHHAGCDI